MLRGMKKQLMFIVIFFIGALGYAKERKAHSANALEAMLAKSRYSVVIFYDSNQAKELNNKDKLKDLKLMVSSLAKDPLYKNTNLQFIFADLERRDLKKAREKYQISNLPLFMIFLGRQPNKERLIGYVYRPQVTNFINQNLQVHMDQYLKEKQMQRQKDLELAKIKAYTRAYYWWSPYWGGYWYGGYYPYWYGPYFW